MVEVVLHVRQQILVQGQADAGDCVRVHAPAAVELVLPQAGEQQGTTLVVGVRPEHVGVRELQSEPRMRAGACRHRAAAHPRVGRRIVQPHRVSGIRADIDPVFLAADAGRKRGDDGDDREQNHSVALHADLPPIGHRAIGEVRTPT